MWSGSNKVWLPFRKDIIAADKAEGVFLADFLRYLTITRGYVNSMEVADLQGYKMLKQPQKVKIAIANSFDTPFIFLINKN